MGSKELALSSGVSQARLDVITLDICLAQGIVDRGQGAALKVPRFRFTGKLCML